MSILGTSALRAAWSPPCGPATSRVRIDLYGSGSITVRRECEAAFRALNDCLRRHNYRTRKADTGAYNCRRITGGTGYSLHAYGIAADINWQTNPYGPRLVTDMPKAMRDDIKALRTNNGKQVFGWGGDYRTNHDAMHWEVVCTPADIATGIAGSAPAAPAPAPRPFRTFAKDATDAGIYAKGGQPTQVSDLQRLLGVKQDGIYGPLTIGAVVAFKTKAAWTTADGKKNDRTSTVDARFFDALRNLGKR